MNSINERWQTVVIKFNELIDEMVAVKPFAKLFYNKIRKQIKNAEVKFNLNTQKLEILTERKEKVSISDYGHHLAEIIKEVMPEVREISIQVKGKND